MKHDIFQSRKSIHVTLEKDVFQSLRTMLFVHGVSMQDIFNEFAKLVVTGNQAANKIVNDAIKARLQQAVKDALQDNEYKAYEATMSKLPMKNDKKRKNIVQLGKLDANSLYSLIESEKNDQENS